MRFEIPDFTLLTQPIPSTTSLKGRIVILHFPTHTLLELATPSEFFVENISPRYEWERINKYGEIDEYVLLAHQFVTDDLMHVFEQAKEWCRAYMDWADANDAAFAEILRNRESDTDDLPN